MSDDPSSSGRNAATGRFTAGNKASHGRQYGQRHKATVMAEKLFGDDIKAVCEVVVREAKAGANWACKLVVERILPPAKDRPTPFKLPPIASPTDLPPIAACLLEAVAKGEMTPAEGDSLLGMLDKLRAVYESADMAQEIADMRAEIERLRGRVEREDS
jgi:hypothetical protein